jgi:hypothetical protein
MVAESETVKGKAAPSRRMAGRILQEEAYRRLQEQAYRRIMIGDMPETLTEFAALLAAWFREAYPTAPIIPERSVEGAIRDTWNSRHGMIGSEL